jgi:hypothetical protein
MLLWQARVGREIERYKREREEEMRQEQRGMRRALSMKLYTTVGCGRRSEQLDALPWVSISWHTVYNLVSRSLDQTRNSLLMYTISVHSSYFIYNRIIFVRFRVKK